jgi:peptidoglycan/xylan/chitin deacetylase (PgdA/CDA1 family)
MICFTQEFYDRKEPPPSSLLDHSFWFPFETPPLLTIGKNQAAKFVDRGHEASGHGQTWEPEYSMTPEQERAGYQASIDTIQRVTGTRPVGFNAFWLRGTPNTLEILQELGFIYHIDDISRDEPFTVTVKGKPFAVVPYTMLDTELFGKVDRGAP